MFFSLIILSSQKFFREYLLSNVLKIDSVSGHRKSFSEIEEKDVETFLPQNKRYFFCPDKLLLLLKLSMLLNFEGTKIIIYCDASEYFVIVIQW